MIDIRTFTSGDHFLENLDKNRKTSSRENVRNKMIFYKPLLPECCNVKIAFRDLV